jgi:hypothetical protein
VGCGKGRRKTKARSMVDPRSRTRLLLLAVVIAAVVLTGVVLFARRFSASVRVPFQERTEGVPEEETSGATKSGMELALIEAVVGKRVTHYAVIEREGFLRRVVVRQSSGAAQMPPLVSVWAAEGGDNPVDSPRITGLHAIDPAIPTSALVLEQLPRFAADRFIIALHSASPTSEEGTTPSGAPQGDFRQSRAKESAGTGASGAAESVEVVVEKFR